jgi:oligopeptide/dipeptide ABC transporter ATP-binding protein
MRLRRARDAASGAAAPAPGAPRPELTGAPGDPPLLEVRDLRVRFDVEDGVVRALDGVSFTVEAGQTLAIVGESGAGKTVAGLSLLGLVPPPGRIDGGQILLRGRDLLALDESEMRRVRGAAIAMVFQDPLAALNPVLTIGDQIGEALQLHLGLSRRERRVRAAALLAEVGIGDAARRLDAYPHQLSGGQRQRAMIAMALSCRPALLVADEPTTALDPTVQAQVIELMQRLQRELGSGIVLISHDLGAVARMADRVAVMYAGRIVEEGPAEAVFARPRHPYTWGLLDSTPRIDAPRGRRLTAIPGSPPSLLAVPSGCPFHPRCRSRRPGCDTLRPELRPVAESQRAACVLDAEEASAERARAREPQPVPAPAP